MTTLWGPGGARFLDETPLGEAYEYRIESLQDLIGRYDREITEPDRRVHRWLRDDAGYRTIQQLSGVGTPEPAHYPGRFRRGHIVPGG